MTREEASQAFLDGEKLTEIFDRIYYDFESRTCEHCKHYITSYLKEKYCDEQVELLSYHHKNFGCNKWEAKSNTI